MWDLNIFIIFGGDNEIIKKMEEYMSRNMEKEVMGWKEDWMGKGVLVGGGREVGK